MRGDTDLGDCLRVAFVIVVWSLSNHVPIPRPLGSVVGVWMLVGVCLHGGCSPTEPT